MAAHRRVRRTVCITLGAVAASWSLALPASAHITVHADTVTAGASDAVIAFRVPNEQDKVTVTKLAVQLPTDHPLLGVLVSPHPGWTSSVKQVTLDPPVKTDDGTVTEAVSEITWTASPTAAIPVGGYDDFTIDVGKLPDGQSSLTFKAIQTYSDNQQVAWIDETVEGQPEPEHPAPVLTLGAAAAGATPTPSQSAAGTTAGPTATASSPATTATAASGSDSTARALGIAGIVLAVILGAGGYLLGRRSGAQRDQPADTPPGGARV
jgi:uncharacterized protein YcnI